MDVRAAAPKGLLPFCPSPGLVGDRVRFASLNLKDKAVAIRCGYPRGSSHQACRAQCVFDCFRDAAGKRMRGRPLG